MNVFKEYKRYPFAIADEDGNVLFLSDMRLDLGDNILSFENVCGADLSLVKKVVSEGRFLNVVLYENRKNSRAVFLLPMLFPSVRVFIAIYADLDYKSAAELCFSHFDCVLLRELHYDVKVGRKHEKLYPAISDIIYSAKTMFSSDVEDEDVRFEDHLLGKIKEIGRFCFCFPEVCYSTPVSHFSSERFDAEIFGYYILLILSAASYLSKERSAKIDIACDGDRIYVKTDIEIGDQAVLRDFEDRFRLAVQKLDFVCSRLNMPFYFVKDGTLQSGILPLRQELSELGLKVPYIDLKYKNENEEDQRNIFLPLSFRSDE